MFPARDDAVTRQAAASLSPVRTGTPRAGGLRPDVGGGELRGLTGLRGVAALLVVPLHATQISLSPDFPSVFVAHGYLWVDLFLVLSGFVLARTYERRPRGRSAMAAVFLARRVARIWPLFALTTGGMVLARRAGLTWFPDRLAERGWPLLANLLMVQAWVGQPSINVPGWSVSGEWACCLLFLPLRRCVSARSAWPAAALVLVAAGTLALLAASPLPVRRGALDLALPVTPLPVIRCMASFVLGMATWRAAGHARLRGVAALPGLDLALGAAIVLLMGWPHTDLAVVLLFPPLVLCLSCGTGPAARALASRPVHALGTISYSIYLLQVPLVVLRAPGVLVAQAERWLAPYGLPQDVHGRLALFYVLLITVSVVSWFAVERPARLLLRRVAPRAA